MARHGSRSSSKGKIVKACSCGGKIRIILSDHYNLIAVCTGCGIVKEERNMPNGLSLHSWDKGRR